MLREKSPAFQPTELPSSSGSNSLWALQMRALRSFEKSANTHSTSITSQKIWIISNTVVRIPNAAAIFLLAGKHTVHCGYAGVCYTLLSPSHPQTSHHSYIIHHFQIFTSHTNMNCEWTSYPLEQSSWLCPLIM